MTVRARASAPASAPDIGERTSAGGPDVGRGGCAATMTVVTGHDPHRDGRQNDGDRRDPVWQPVSRVGPMTEMVAGQVEHSRHMYELLERARPAHRGAVPEQVLDDATVSRTVEVYGRMAGDYRAEFAEQARRWQRQQGLDARTREQVEAFAARVDEHLVLLDELLALAEELAPTPSRRSWPATTPSSAWSTWPVSSASTGSTRTPTGRRTRAGPGRATLRTGLPKLPRSAK